MSNYFSGFGNVGTAPTLRRVPVGGEQRPVADLRVYFDRRVPKGEGQFEDEGGFWLTVSVWGARAETVTRLIEKGVRIYVEGTLRQESWQDKDTGADRSELRLTADAIALDLLCVESVQYRKRSGGSDGGGDPAGPADEEIPY
jgi:single-strand DNA-binding protein